ncbi:hypothetical protein Tco_1255323 [Tanacetum coccineum]
MSDMTACLNDLIFIPPNNDQNEPTQGDIGEIKFFQEAFPTRLGYKLPPSHNEIKKTFKMIRLQRLYKSNHTTKQMTWHATGKSIKNGKMLHPVDGKAWKNFDIHVETRKEGLNRNSAVFIARTRKHLLWAVPAVPDISGGRDAYPGAAPMWTLPFLSCSEEGSGIFNDHHFNKNTANNLPLRDGHSIVDPSCDVLSLGALYSWEFFLKFYLHACDPGS